MSTMDFNLGTPLQPNTDPGMVSGPEKGRLPSIEFLPSQDPMGVMRRMKKGSKLHTRVYKMLDDRLTAAEHRMGDLYARMQVNELKHQAYIDLPKYQKIIKDAVDQGKPPIATSIVIPYAWATLDTVVTNLVHLFTGQKPYFQVQPSKEESAAAAGYMEAVLQYNLDHVRWVKLLKQQLVDAGVYGFGALRTAWQTENRITTVRTPGLPPERKPATVWEGTDIYNIDPFRFFPDPRVPMSEVNKRGEFVFWRWFEGKHTLKKAEQEGHLFYIDDIKKGLPENHNQHDAGGSFRNYRWGIVPDPADDVRNNAFDQLDAFVQLDQGTVDLVPRDWGLGDRSSVEKWIFTLANRDTIIQAEPFTCDHNMHPVTVIEPWSVGYSFTQAGLVDFIAPAQDGMSWFHNSHVFSVETGMNQIIFYDPEMVSKKAIETSKPGMRIPVTNRRYGDEIKQAAFQLNVSDPTINNIADMREFQRMSDNISGATESLRGIEREGNRKTAAESRMLVEGAGSRLALLATLISSQGLVDLEQQMVMNQLQYMSDEFYINVVGMRGMENPIAIRPEMLVGDFVYPVHDGTKPVDKLGMLEQWKEIFATVSGDPDLSFEWKKDKILEKLAELSGIKDLSRFRRSEEEKQAIIEAQQAQLEKQNAAGNAPTVDEAMGNVAGLTAEPNYE